MATSGSKEFNTVTSGPQDNLRIVPDSLAQPLNCWMTSDNLGNLLGKPGHTFQAPGSGSGIVCLCMYFSFLSVSLSVQVCVIMCILNSVNGISQSVSQSIGQSVS